MKKRGSIKERIKGITIKNRHKITVCSIVLGFLGIGALLVSIILDKNEKEKAACSLSTESSARAVTSARWHPGRRKFNEGLYPRVSLDSLETDYENYADWIERYADYLDSLMDLGKPIDLNVIGKPVLTSSLPGELEDFQNNYLQSIETYNKSAYKLEELENKSVIVNNVTPLVEILSAVFIALSTVLQLVLAFHTYYNETDKSHSLDDEYETEKKSQIT